MREYICSHPTYKEDSHVNERIMYDLAVKCDSISRGLTGCPELFGNPKTKTTDADLPRCVKVNEEVIRVTEKILAQEQENAKLKTEAETNGTLDDRLTKTIGVGVGGGPGHVQM